MKRLLIAAAMALALPGASASAQGKAAADDIVVSGTWARATPRGAKVGGGYATIKNAGKEPDRLIGGSLEVAGKVEVHEMRTEGSIMKMRSLDKGLEIEPGATVTLEPGKIHLMFMELKQPLVAGDKVAGTLVFERAGKLNVEFDVKQPAGSADPHGGHHH